MYTTKIGDKICEATATSSIGLRHICKQLHLPYSTVTGWVYQRGHDLCKKYANAKIMQLHHLAEEILEIADDSTNDYMTVVKNGKKYQVQNRETISRSRLRIQARMNLISKLSPILRDTKTGQSDSRDVIIRRLPYPNETPEEYAASQKLRDEEIDAAIARTGQLLRANKAAGKHQPANKNVPGASSENIVASSPKNTIKPALEEPLRDTALYTEYAPVPEKPRAKPNLDAEYAREQEELHASFNARSQNDSSFCVFNNNYLSR